MAAVVGAAALGAVVAFAAPTAALAAVGFPFVDVNDNGVHDPGVDSGDITADLLAGPFSTPDSVVIPADARPLITKKLGGFRIEAGKGIAVLANLVVQGDGGITLVAHGGDLVIGDKRALKGGVMFLSAQGDVVLGKSVQLDAKGGPVVGTGDVTLYSAEGDVVLRAGARVNARDDVEIIAATGGVAIGPNAQITAKSGILNIHADADVNIVGSKLKGQSINVFTFGSWLGMQNDVVRASEGGWVSIAAFGTDSTIDCSDTRWEGVSPDNLLMSADVVLDQ